MVDRAGSTTKEVRLFLYRGCLYQVKDFVNSLPAIMPKIDVNKLLFAFSSLILGNQRPMNETKRFLISVVLHEIISAHIQQSGIVYELGRNHGRKLYLG